MDPHAKSYDRAAGAYERGRPEYPPEAVAYLASVLGLSPATRVLDLAAGTGKFTRQLVASGADIVAVEPIAGMRARLRENLPTIDIREGTAESIPLADQSVDAVTVAQAFHWFRGPEALREIHRVLKPEGILALVWNVRDESVDWVRRLSGLMDPHGGGAPRYHTGLWRKAFEEPNGFTSLVLREFPFAHGGTLEQIVDRAASTSFVAGMTNAAREALLEEIRHMLRTHPQTRGLETIVFPYRTEVYTCSKL